MTPNLYIIHSLDDIPLGANYRILANRLDQPDADTYIETRDPVDGLDVAPDTYENGAPVWIEDCGADWYVRAQDDDPVQSQIDSLTSQLQGLSDQFPDKVSAAMSTLQSSIGLKQSGGTLKVGG